MSTINNSRSWSYKVHRDVKIVFDVFVETLQGGTPGQAYVVNYERGPKEHGHSEPVSASADGSVHFKYSSSFVSTMQRKNDTSYKRKEFRLWVTEHPSGYIVSDLIYDLAGPIENEVFPNKKLMVKSPNGESKLLFCITGINEDDYIHLMSDKGRPSGTFQRSQSAASPEATDTRPLKAAATQPEDLLEDDEEDDERDRNQQASSVNARAAQKRQPTKEDQSKQQTNAGQAVRTVANLHDDEDDDDDLEFMVDGAVAQVSGRRGGNTPTAQNTPKGNHRSESPAPRAAITAEQSSSAVGTTKSTAPPQSRPPANPAPEAAATPSESPQGTTSTAAPSQSAVGRSISPSVVAPPPREDSPIEPQVRPAQVHLRSSADYVRSDTRQDAAVRSSTPVAESLESVAVPQVYQRTDASKSRHAPVPSNTLSTTSSSRADVSPINESLSRFINDAPRSVSVATTVATSRNEKEVEKYLSEINAAVIAMANDTMALPSASDSVSTQLPASASTGLHTFNVAGASKTASSIPRAALLALHCLGYWSGLRRVIFLHDFISMLFVDVVPHTRHAAQWMNVLLHVLFHTLTQGGDDVDNYYEPLSEDDAVQMSDDLTQCILDAEECGFGSRNRFMCRGSRDDRLFHLVARDGGNEEASVPGAQVPPMHPGASIILTIGIDEALRRLSLAASSAAVADIERFCYPPPVPPTRHTGNGYHYSGPVDGSVSGFNTPFGVGGGGPDHVTEDAAFSVVLNALNRLFLGLHGVTKSQPGGASALLRLTAAELFKIIFRNINNTLLNNIVTKDRSGKLKSRVRTIDDAMNLKLALSLFEAWLQEHQLFIAARAELLGCRQVCDLIILHKRLLMNIELSDEVTSTLTPEMVVFLLEQYQPSAKETPLDTVPVDVINAFKREVEERSRVASRSSKKPHSNALAGAPTPLPTRSLATFPFLDFVSSLIPFQEDEEASSQKRRSLRYSIAAASKVKGEDNGATASSSLSFQPRALAKAEQRTLDWDQSDNRLTYLRNREAFLGVSTTHDPDGKKLTEDEARDAQARLGLRVVALSVAEEDVIRRMVV
ncbi:ribosomal P protein AGP2beta-2, putative [Bodo saltans]|uniref:Ribosomal P protein AGP2beta-2, putative n=1 Tax=Bodo saltans TaxID=75058 RepID=A0A0S4JLU2_BODSA|nr:ribosomal P protein AGP2beta-2, putative [Bodo saltans]|eukprot:CUG91092.1 ribosomal P protein AGP2beta-2, putative [Bodo saltans]